MKQMKKFAQIFFASYLFCLSFFCIMSQASAGTIYTIKVPDGKKCYIRTEPNNGGSYLIPGHTHYLDTGDKVELVEEPPVASTNSSLCTTSYYAVLFSGLKGYICGDYIQFETSNKFDKEWEQLGFPKSYWASLTLLKEAHPNWEFKVVNPTKGTGQKTTFAEVVAAESVPGTSLILTNNEGWLSTADASYNHYTDTFYNKDGGYKDANEQTVAYFLDPRNFLNDPNVYMFLALDYNDSYAIEGVQSILNGSCMAGSYTDSEGTFTYAEAFMRAAKETGVSPYLLATRAKQEINGSPTCSQSATGNVPGYEGLYNFFNIGAYPSDGKGAIENGLIYARNKGWDTVYKSLVGGGQLLGNGYIARGQNNLYFQKWDVKNGNYSNQYMTNIQAPKAEAEILAASYASISSSLVFEIPVYEQMPEKTTLPNPGNPNNYLNSLTVNGEAIDQFHPDRFTYEKVVDAGTRSITIGASTVSSKASVSGLGAIELTSNDQTVTVRVTAQNGATRDYQIRITKINDVPISVDDVIHSLPYKNEGTYLSGIALATNIDTIMSQVKQINGFVQVQIKDANGIPVSNKAVATGQQITITSGSETKTFLIVVAGDPTGDGLIDLGDMLRIQKIILGAVAPSEVYLKAADANHDGIVDIGDLLSVQKHILNVKPVQQ